MRILLLALFSILTTNAHAADAIYGQLVKAPATVKALSERGQIEEYNITSILNSVYASNSSVSLSNNGAMTMCGTYYGQLAEDFSVVVKLKDNSEKTITVRAANKDRKVSVFGVCQGDSRDLEQLQIDVSEGAGLEIR